MNHSQTDTFGDMNGREFRRLLSAWCDNNLEDVDLTRLQALLVRSYRARREYIAYMDVNASIHDHIAVHQFLETVIELPPGGNARRAGSEGQDLAKCRPARWRLLGRPDRLAALAAMLLIGIVGVWQIARMRSSAPRIASQPIVAHVSHESNNCQWFVGETRRESLPRGAICRGETIRVISGRLKLAYPNGTVVTLHAPALYKLRSDMLGRVWLGKLTAKVTKGGEGFTIETPRANVIDLGTEFGIEVDNLGATDVVVFEGAVDLAYLDSLDDEVGRQQRLFMGEGMHLDSLGTASRIVSITNQRFSDEMIEAAHDVAHPIAISQVRDNVQRDDAWNYYEIVHAGMREDALAYVDRIAHQYNGVDKTGMPSYLLGGDYVKTFNNDKVDRDIRIDVTLDVPARLYILLDKRLEAPQWLRDEFTETGDVIGIDTGPFKSKGAWHNNEEPPGVGPGESVEDVLAVWVRVVRQPGVVHLGATEAPESGPNMYGIVAVPLEFAY